jgi:hypothetical protein
MSSNNWYTEHPVVSTVLWFLGTPAAPEIEQEDEPKKPTRCLSWKDEHDGGPIAEYCTSPNSINTNEKLGLKAPKNSLKEDANISRKQSLTTLPRNESDVIICIYLLL